MRSPALLPLLAAMALAVTFVGPRAQAPGGLPLGLPKSAVGPAYAPEPPAAVRLQLRRLRGQLHDRENLPVEGASLALFLETPGHKMLALAVSDTHGKFDFGPKLAPGNYQLVAQYPGLCTAHVPVTVSPRARHSQIVFTMTVPSLGACSSARVK